MPAKWFLFGSSVALVLGLTATAFLVGVLVSVLWAGANIVYAVESCDASCWDLIARLYQEARQVRETGAAPALSADVK